MGLLYLLDAYYRFIQIIPQIRPLVNTVHYKGSYLLTYFIIFTAGTVSPNVHNLWGVCTLQEICNCKVYS